MIRAPYVFPACESFITHLLVDLKQSPPCRLLCISQSPLEQQPQFPPANPGSEASKSCRRPVLSRKVQGHALEYGCFASSSECPIRPIPMVFLTTGMMHGSFLCNLDRLKAVTGQIVPQASSRKPDSQIKYLKALVLLILCSLPLAASLWFLLIDISAWQRACQKDNGIRRSKEITEGSNLPLLDRSKKCCQNTFICAPLLRKQPAPYAPASLAMPGLSF